MKFNSARLESQESPSPSPHARRRLLGALGRLGTAGLGLSLLPQPLWAQTPARSSSGSTSGAVSTASLPAWLDEAQLTPLLVRAAQASGQSVASLRQYFTTLSPQPQALALAYPVPDPNKPKPAPSLSKTIARQVNAVTLKAGRAFVDQHRASLKLAESRYGVPAHVLAGIIGVETRFGKVQGSFPTLETLATLGFQGPRRQAFFQDELVELLLLSGQLGRDPRSIQGSFAGALGIPQFMPSSYRRYAVDLDGDGQIDLFGSPADAIGSVGSFLLQHGWKTGEPLWAKPRGLDAEQALSSSQEALRQRFLVKTLSVGHQARDLIEARLLQANQPFGPEMACSLVELPEPEGQPVTWAVGSNFFAITQYNRSYLYAAGVIALAEALQG